MNDQLDLVIMRMICNWFYMQFGLVCPNLKVCIKGVVDTLRIPPKLGLFRVEC